MGLSPDGKWALSIVYALPHRLLLYPTGPGVAKVVKNDAIEAYLWAGWFPDGKRILFAGNEPGRSTRLYAQDLDGGRPRPVGPEGVVTEANSLSPDGRLVAASPQAGDAPAALYPIDGGEPRPIAGLGKDGLPVRWSADGRWLYIRERPSGPLTRIHRLDVATGRKEPWKELTPPAPFGASGGLFYVALAPEVGAYVYTYFSRPSQLYLVEGLK